MKTKTRSVEEKLFTAYQKNRGVRLTAEDVEALLVDEAIGSRISNAAAIECDMPQPGADCVRQTGDTWEQFKAGLKRDYEGTASNE